MRVSLRGAYAGSTYVVFLTPQQKEGGLTKIAYAVHTKHRHLCVLFVFFVLGYGPPVPTIYMYIHVYILKIYDIIWRPRAFLLCALCICRFLAKRYHQQVCNDLVTIVLCW